MVTPSPVEATLARFIAEAQSELGQKLAERLDPNNLPQDVTGFVSRMLSICPTKAPKNPMADLVGPEFFDTTGTATYLAGPGNKPLTKQAIADRRARSTVLAVQSSDRKWLYPTWQFHEHRVLPGLAPVLKAFDDQPRWAVATWIATPNPDLEHTSVKEWLLEGKPHSTVVCLAQRESATLQQ